MTDTDATGEHTDRLIRVELTVELGETDSCPLSAFDGTGGPVWVNAVGSQCTIDMDPTIDDGEIIRRTGHITDNCLCLVFQRFDCVPRINGVADGTVEVTTYLDDRTQVRELVTELRSATDGVRLDKLVLVSGHDRTEQVTLDLSELTPKQRETLELAVVKGYFDKDVRLEEIATELGISKSALSQRLRAAQANLVRAVFDG